MCFGSNYRVFNQTNFTINKNNQDAILSGTPRHKHQSDNRGPLPLNEDDKN